MVLYCCAFNCKEKYVKGGPYTFHRCCNSETRRSWKASSDSLLLQNL
ncbi:unnamed protein product [Larinioides sclopetarius]|uniref:THAP-type domain-containing protein n=1 Tax=Larinioides sclopetarius TaxID=280406 RepID=A0AAV2AA54_9ARAC